MLHTPRVCPGPSTRREFLQAGALGLGAFTLPQLMRIRAAQAATGTARQSSVIYVWLPGGPPHLDMYDMKPNASSDIRGVFNPIATNVPGLDVCELMPRHAQCADKYTLVRSVAHDFADHGGGHKRLMTGRIPKTPVGTENDAPAVGSIIAKMREGRRTGVPNYVLLADPGRDGIDVFAMGPAYLGPSYVPFTVAGDPSRPEFEVPNLRPQAQVADRLENRSQLLRGLDRIRREVDQHGVMSSIDEFQARAMELVTSASVREAFDLTREAPATRERYGSHAWGQRALMARRLVEAGCSLVTLVMENPYQSGIEHRKNGVYNWDSHAVNCHIFEDLQARLPIYDQAVTALVEDIYARGLDRDVLLVVTGEFGRTPRIESQKGTQTGLYQPGRDHWPQAMAMLLAGGGMRTGQVVGATNSKGEHPIERILTPNDLWATVYNHLGIDPEVAFPDFNGRPMPILPFGAPIEELLPTSNG